MPAKQMTFPSELSVLFFFLLPVGNVGGNATTPDS